MKPIFIIVILVLGISFHANAQKAYPGLAKGGGAGIYIELGRAMVSKQKPYMNIESYLIERQEVNASNWEHVVLLSAPDTYEDFLIRLAESTLHTPEPVYLTEQELKVFWNQIQKSKGRVDSIFYTGLLPIRLALGLAYLDTSAVTGTTYTYRVSTKRTDNSLERTVYSTPVAFPSRLQINPPTFVTKSYRNNEVLIKWQILNASNITFVAFRRIGLSPFQLISPIRVANQKGDTLFVSIRDTLIQPTLDYEYFIVPQDFYGNFSSISDTVKIFTSTVQNMMPPQNLKAVNLNEDRDSILQTTYGIKLTWTAENIDGVKSITIFRSETWDGEYLPIAEISPKEMLFIDQSAEEMKPHYYRVQFNGFFGETSFISNRVFSIPQNLTPPNAPHLTATSTGEGIELSLSSEEDVVGYRIYRADSNDSLCLISGLIPKTNEINTTFLDSTVKDNPKVYKYAARAENKSFLMSVFSEMSLVQFKRVSRPVSPLNFGADLQAEDGLKQSCLLHWEDMTPFVHGLIGYKLYSKVKGSIEDFKPLHSGMLYQEQNHYLDTTLQPGTEFVYAIELYDNSGGRSALATTTIKTFSNSKVASPSNIKALASDNSVLIRWDEINHQSLQFYKVFRYERGKNAEQLAILPSDINEFLDTTAQKENLYFYFVKSLTKDGEESEESDVVGIRL